MDEFVKKQMDCRRKIINSLDMIEANMGVFEMYTRSLHTCGNDALAIKLEGLIDNVTAAVKTARDSYQQETTNYIALDQKTNRDFLETIRSNVKEAIGGKETSAKTIITEVKKVKQS